VGPGDLARILKGLPPETDPNLLVGAATADDAGVYRLSDELALIQTVDFFTPMVNEPRLFGRIAAANALSDVYAMGGRPLCAMNICCFPVKEHPPELFREILLGGHDKLKEAGCALAGGHSVEDPELKYGLSVSGLVHPERMVTNAGLGAGQVLFLTKPLGTGIIATALKAKMAPPEALAASVEVMTTLNSGGAEVMAACGVTGATDVTGFGLLGHALEMARASGVSLAIEAGAVPILAQARELAGMGMVPLGSHANRDFCSSQVRISGPADRLILDILTDAQTSGGLLMAVDQDQAQRAEAMLAQRGLASRPIGRVGEPGDAAVEVVF